MSIKDTLNPAKFFPFLVWLKTYDAGKLSKDFIAGLTVAIILIPQGMAYSMLAGLPPVYGLYAALLGTAVSALWGNSRHLSTGPAAVISFLVLTALVPLAKPETPKFITSYFLPLFLLLLKASRALCDSLQDSMVRFSSCFQIRRAKCRLRYVRQT